MLLPIRSAVALTLMVAASQAAADHHPALVIPGTPGVPVVIDGVDASYGVVEGDWGLYRPGAGVRTVYPSYWTKTWRGAGYFPATGRAPAYGRFEIEPRRAARPRGAPSYRRSWSTQSSIVPAELPRPAYEMPLKADEPWPGPPRRGERRRRR